MAIPTTISHRCCSAVRSNAVLTVKVSPAEKPGFSFAELPTGNGIRLTAVYSHGTFVFTRERKLVLSRGKVR